MMRVVARISVAPSDRPEFRVSQSQRGSLVALVNEYGGADTQVSPLHAIQLGSALQKLGKRYVLKIFYGEDHIPAVRALERDEEAVKWFRRFDEPPSRP